MEGMSGQKRTNSYIISLGYLLLIYFTLIGLGPILFNVLFSFVKTDLMTKFKFAGLSNYRYLINDTIFWKSLWHNIFYLIVLVPTGLVTSLVLAALIYQTTGVAKKIYTAMYFTPVVTSIVAVSLVWKLLYFPKVGVFAVLISKIFGISPPLLIDDPKIALLCIILMDVWWHTGLRTVVLLAGMEEIPEELYDAARIDGASPISQFFRITIPLVRPQILFLIAIYSINALSRTFRQIYMISGSPPGGPSHST
ncbi:MAG: carbohydrate ABC transporter permease, partial [Planctomycetota bacterium]